MKIWTALQEPLRQAILIEDGQIIKSIPDHPARTPSRFVGPISQYNDQLVIGRRNSIELWDMDGSRQDHLIYHPWIYGLHDIKQLGNNLIVACSHLDVVFEIDLESNVQWSWWAYQHGYAAEPTFVWRNDWPYQQLVGEIAPHNEVHLNSVNIHEGKCCISLLKNRTALNVDQHSTTVIETIPEDGLHDYKFIDGIKCYGFDSGLVIGDCKYTGYEWVKRIVKHEDCYWFTHEKGISFVKDGQISDWAMVPRPFGLVFM